MWNFIKEVKNPNDNNSKKRKGDEKEYYKSYELMKRLRGDK